MNKDESVASNVKKICYRRRIFKKDGFMDPQEMFDAIKDGTLDLESFMSSLK